MYGSGVQASHALLLESSVLSCFTELELPASLTFCAWQALPKDSSPTPRPWSLDVLAPSPTVADRPDGLYR
jgi:hypothetical protein